MKHENSFKYISLSAVIIWLLLFAFLPFCLVVIASFLSDGDTHLIQLPFTTNNYQQLCNSLYLHIFKKSFLLAANCTLICLILGYPFAYIIGRMQSRWKNLLVLLVIIPFWTSSLIRSYALIGILKAKGLINSLLIGLGIIHEPLSILFTNTAVVIGLVYNLLPFMILPIMTNVERLDYRLIDAARDLGAPPFTILRRVILPITMPGILAGSILVFLPAMTIFYIPDILGGAKSILLGNLIQNQFLIAENWPMGSATSVVLSVCLIILVAIYWRISRGNQQYLL